MAADKSVGEKKEEVIKMEMERTIVGKEKLENLDSVQREFLKTLTFESDSNDDGICVYVQMQMFEGFKFIEDFKMPLKSNERFEKEAPAGLWRGGVVCLVQYDRLVLVVPDERMKWFKPIPAGIAHFQEGIDLTNTAAAHRKIVDELFIISLAKVDGAAKTVRQARYLPKGFNGQANRNNRALGLEVQEIKEVGEVVFLGYNLNTTNRALEAVFLWNISEIPLDEITISLNEDWSDGGNSGISIYALNQEGNIAGVFSGQQGFQEIPKYRIHETLAKYLKILPMPIWWGTGSTKPWPSILRNQGKSRD